MTVTVTPTSAKRNACKAIRAAAAGVRRAAGLAHYQSLLGTNWKCVLYRNAVAVATLNYTTKQISVASNQFVLPAYDSLSGLTTADINTGTWTWEIMTTADSGTTLKLAGTLTITGGTGEFLLSNSLAAGGSLTLGTVNLYFDPAIESATFYPQPYIGFTESADKTTVTTTTAQITNYEGVVVKLTAGAQISYTTPAGVTTTDATTANVVKIYYQNDDRGKYLWHQNTQLLWWRKQAIAESWVAMGAQGPTTTTTPTAPSDLLIASSYTNYTAGSSFAVSLPAASAGYTQTVCVAWRGSGNGADTITSAPAEFGAPVVNRAVGTDMFLSIYSVKQSASVVARTVTFTFSNALDASSTVHTVAGTLIDTQTNLAGFGQTQVTCPSVTGSVGNLLVNVCAVPDYRRCNPAAVIAARDNEAVGVPMSLAGGHKMLAAGGGTGAGAWNIVSPDTGASSPAAATGVTLLYASSAAAPAPPPVPGQQIPQPSRAPDGTAIATWLTTTPRVVSDYIAGLHMYDWPVRTPYHVASGYTSPVGLAKLKRSLNTNDGHSSMYWIFQDATNRRWEQLDADLDACAAAGMKYLFTAYLTPAHLVDPARTSWPSPAPNWLGSTTMPTNLTTWTNHVTELVNHCNTRRPGVLVGVEVWNEPAVNGNDYYSSGARGSEYWFGSVIGDSGANRLQRLQDLRDLHKATWNGVQAATTPVPVHGPPFSPETISDASVVTYYTTACTTGGTPASYTNKFSCHAYTTGTNATTIASVYAQGVSNRNAVNAAWELWDSESGDETSGGQSAANHRISIIRKAIIAAAKGYTGHIAYAFEDWQYLGNPGGGGDPSQPVQTSQAEPRDGLQRVYNMAGKTMDYAAIDANGRVWAWFRDLTTEGA